MGLRAQSGRRSGWPPPGRVQAAEGNGRCSDIAAWEGKGKDVPAKAAVKGNDKGDGGIGWT